MRNKKNEEDAQSKQEFSTGNQSKTNQACTSKWRQIRNSDHSSTNDSQDNGEKHPRLRPCRLQSKSDISTFHYTKSQNVHSSTPAKPLQCHNSKPQNVRYSQVAMSGPVKVDYKSLVGAAKMCNESMNQKIRTKGLLIRAKKCC